MDVPLQKSNSLHLAVDQHQVKVARSREKNIDKGQEKENYKSKHQLELKVYTARTFKEEIFLSACA